jgi:hypothetical protein
VRDGGLINDLVTYFRPRAVFDPMHGSGTCRDVCEDLGVACQSGDIHQGFDACAPGGFGRGRFDLVWCHPPYWRQKLYSEDPRDLARAPSLDAFLDGLMRFLANGAEDLTPQGKLTVLMGDYCDREQGFLPLVYQTKRLAFAAGLRQHCTDIVRFLHGTSSADKVDRTKFIPGLHDVCTVFERNN